jgi:hypothetical protein
MLTHENICSRGPLSILTVLCLKKKDISFFYPSKNANNKKYCITLFKILNITRIFRERHSQNVQYAKGAIGKVLHTIFLTKLKSKFV